MYFNNENKEDKKGNFCLISLRTPDININKLINFINTKCQTYTYSLSDKCLSKELYKVKNINVNFILRLYFYTKLKK